MSCRSLYRLLVFPVSTPDAHGATGRPLLPPRPSGITGSSSGAAVARSHWPKPTRRSRASAPRRPRLRRPAASQRTIEGQRSSARRPPPPTPAPRPQGRSAASRPRKSICPPLSSNGGLNASRRRRVKQLPCHLRQAKPRWQSTPFQMNNLRTRTRTTNQRRHHATGAGCNDTGLRNKGWSPREPSRTPETQETHAPCRLCPTRRRIPQHVVAECDATDRNATARREQTPEPRPRTHPWTSRTPPASGWLSGQVRRPQDRAGLRLMSARMRRIRFAVPDASAEPVQGCHRAAKK